MDWDKLRIFHAAADAGSFTHAGDQLRMSQSAVSRQVAALEKDLGVALFHRHARGLVLTEQGELLFRTATEILSKLSTAETLLTDATTKPAGELRVTAPTGLGTIWVTQRLREFLDLYPEIRVELILTDEQLDISMRAADVAIWTSEPQHSDIIRRPLFSMQVHAYASPQYIKRSGTPQTLDDLEKHRIVSYSGTPQSYLSAIRWLETAGRDGKSARTPAFAANSVIAMKYALRAGLGVGMLPDYMTSEESELVPVLRDVTLPTMQIYFCYPEELKTAKKVQVFRDFMVAKSRQWKF
jgi:DNA-binding transcriptional LysR family regulator